MENTRKIFISNSIIIFGIHILIYLKGVFLMPLLIKNLGPTFYGGYAILISTFGFVFGISSFGAGFKINRYLPSIDDLNKRGEIFYNAFYFNLLTILIFSIIFIIFSDIFKKLFFGNIIGFSAVIIFWALIGNLIHHYFTNYFRYTHRLKHFAIASALAPYLFILIVFLLIFTNHPISLDSLIICNLISILIPGIPLMVLAIKEIGIWRKPDLKLLVEDIKIGYPLTFTYILDFILSGGDRYVISYFLTVTAIAYYNPAYTLGFFIILIPKALGVAIQPPLAKAYDAGDNETVAKLMIYSIKLFYWLIFPFIAATAILSKPILSMLATPDIANNSFLITPIISVGALFYGLILIYGFLLFLTLKTKEIFYANALSAILNIVLNIIFIFIFKNVIVAAITTLLCYIITFLYVRNLIRKYISINFKILAGFYFKLLSIVICWACVLYALEYYIKLNIFLIIGIGFISYIALSILAGVVDKSDLLKFKSV